MMFNFPGKTMAYVSSQVEELSHSLTEDEYAEFEELLELHDLQYWQVLLEKNSDLIADFLRRTPKQRNAKLKKKYKDHWVMIHILALLAIKQTEAFVSVAQSSCLSDHYRELTADCVCFVTRIQQALNKLDLSLDHTW